MEIKIDYDSENDILYLYSENSKVDFSVDYDDIVLDVSGNNITGIEILGASEKFARDDLDASVLRRAMGSINNAYFNVDYGASSIMLKIGFVSSEPRKDQNLFIQIPLKKDLVLA